MKKMVIGVSASGSHVSCAACDLEEKKSWLAS